jgi:chemotaxis protein CheX
VVQTDDIFAITQNVLETMLQVTVEPSNEQTDMLTENCMTGCIQISGGWKGAVLLQTSEEFASIAASKLLLVNESDVCAEDRQDTLAELTNMVGGNIKSIVPGPSNLSLPSVTSGKDFDIRLVGSSVDNRVHMNCQGQGICVVICKADDIS